MARKIKNISNNQWFKDIIDNVYLNTAVLNDILIITVKEFTTYRIDRGTIIATIRNPELFQTSADNQVTNYRGDSIRIVNGKLEASTDLYPNNTGFTYITLKSKQLETDFYSTEQLAAMYPDDPTYQVTTAKLADETKPVVDQVDDMVVT